MIDHWSVFIPPLGCKNVPATTPAIPTMPINILRMDSGNMRHPCIFGGWRLIKSKTPPPTLSKKPCGSWYVALDLLRWWWHSSGEFLFALPWVSQHLLRHGLYSATKQAIMTFSTVQGALKPSFPCSLQAYNPTGMNQIKEMYILYIYIYNSMSENW